MLSPTLRQCAPPAGALRLRDGGGACANAPQVADVALIIPGRRVRGCADLAFRPVTSAGTRQTAKPRLFLSFPLNISLHNLAYRKEMKDNGYMSQTTAQQCAYPGCEQPVAARNSDRGAKPKYCDDASHNPLNAHRERRKREADATGQRAEETGGQPVTIGLTRAAELVSKLEQLTAQHAEALARAITELRSAADPESAEAEVYATRAAAGQRVAAAEARPAEEITRRRDAETERDQARADRDQADDATAQAIARMEELTRELTTLRHTTAEQLTQLRAETTTELEHARATAERETGQAREHAERQAAEATGRARQAGQEAARAQQSETAAQQRADRARPRPPRKSPSSEPTPAASATSRTKKT